MTTKDFLESEGLEFKGHLCPEATKNNAVITTYGGDICNITIDGEDIRNIFPSIEDGKSLDDELEYHLTDEIIKFVLDKLNIPFDHYIKWKK